MRAGSHFDRTENADMTRVLAPLAAVLLALSACRGTTGGNMPLVPSEVSQSASCAPSLFIAPRAPAYADTIWPSEKHDQWRTAAVAAGLPAQRHEIRTQTAALPPVRVWGYVGLDGAL
jgi:hypothetical protein